MRDEIFKMFYPLARKQQDELAQAVQASDDDFEKILAKGAKCMGCRQTRKGKSIFWLDDSGGIEAMFFRIVDPRDVNAIRGVYDEIVENNCLLSYVFIRQLPDSEDAWDIFRLSERSFMEHCNRISGPGDWCEDDEEDTNKPRKFKVENVNISGSEFRHVNMSQTVFEDIDFSGSKFFNMNLRETQIGAVDFGGASFSCMNTGEDRPRKPVTFQNIELDDCTIRNCYFRNTKITDCDLTGMTIDGVPVTDMVKTYEAVKNRKDR